VSAASGCAWLIACATAAFRAVVRPDQVPLRGATTSIVWVLRVSVALRLLVVVCSPACGGCTCRCRCVERGWVYGLVSSCLVSCVSFRLSDRPSRSDEYALTAKQQCPGTESRCCGAAIPGQDEEQRILETELQAGPRRQDAGTVVCRQYAVNWHAAQ
jgi:hypothetical protein